MRTHSYIKLILCLFVPLAIGAIAGYATATNIDTWYQTISKPSFNPPNSLFGPVWTILYLLMGVSLYMALQTDNKEDNRKILIAFVLQLSLNFCWSFLFFLFQNIGLALIEILLMWCSILYMIITFHKINKWSAYINLPYLAWVSFATILNASIYYLN